jgi:hypothetical protein
MIVVPNSKMEAIRKPTDGLRNGGTVLAFNSDPDATYMTLEEYAMPHSK